MKRILSLLLAFAIIISAGNSYAFAVDANIITLTVEDVSVNLGDSQVAVKINMQGNTGISGFSFCLNHSDYLLFTGAEIAIDGGYKVIKEIDGFGVNLAWTSGVDYTENGNLATLYFDIDGNAEPGNIPLKIMFRDGYDSVYKTINGHESDLSVQLFDGVCSITDSTLLNSMSVAVDCVKAHADDTLVAVPVRVNNNTGFSGFSFCVNYDKTQLELVRAEISIADGYKVVNHPSGYDVGLAWTSGTEYAENAEIACLYFNVLENAKAGKALIQIVYRPGYDSFYKTVNHSEQDILCQSENGHIEITHFYGDWTVVKPSTCTETGIKKRCCLHDGCEESEEDTVPLLSHEYSKTITPPSCQNRGYTTYTCIYCADSYISDYTDAIGHTGGIATCHSKAVCSRCNAEYGTFDAHNHDGGSEIRNIESPTCEEEGYTGNTYCLGCGTLLSFGSSIEATGHDWDSGEITTQPTCTETGIMTYTCKHDEHHTYTEVIPAAGHTPSDAVRENEKAPTCEIDGSYDEVVYCSVCHAEISRNQKTVSATGHEWNEGVVTTPATCTENGVKTYTCQHDVSHTYTDAIPATGHTPAEAVTENEVAATCCAEGSYDEVTYCSVCGQEVSREHKTIPIDEDAHDWGEWARTKEPTAAEAGEETRTCNNDPTHTETREIPPLGPSEIELSFLDREVVIVVPNGAIPDDSEFDVQKIVPPPTEVVDKVHDQLGGNTTVLAYYEVRLTADNGNAIIHLNSEITIKTKMPEQYIGNKCVKVLQEDETGKLITMTSWWESEYLCYKTDWLEIYN